MTDPVLLAFTFAFGALIGSFLNVCIARWPEGESVVRPRSRCPRCRHAITWYENVPLLSWVALRARCRGCGERISAVYPAVEVATGIAWLAAAWYYGATPTALRVAVFTTLLLGVTLTDATRYTIPDGFTVFGLIFALGAAVVEVLRSGTSPFAGVYGASMGALVGAGAIAILGWLGEVAFRKEAMGFGDVTLMAMVGAFLGPGRTLLTILLGAALAATIFPAVVYPMARLRRGRGMPQLELALGAPSSGLPLVPFGVFLAPAALVALLWGSDLLAWYLRGLQG